MVHKIPDNLKPEGQFEQRQSIKWYPGDRAERVIRKDNLRMEGDRQLIAFSRHEYNATANDGMHLYIDSNAPCASLVPMILKTYWKRKAQKCSQFFVI